MRPPGPALVALGVVLALGAGMGVGSLVSPLLPGADPRAGTADLTAAPSDPGAGDDADAASGVGQDDGSEPEPEPDPEPEPTWTGGAGPDCGGPESYEPPGDETVFAPSIPGDGDGTNGRVPASAMAVLNWCADAQGNQQWLRADAAVALVALNAAFAAEFGENIAIESTYRSFADQQAVREHDGPTAARPGTSNHGWGTAFDTWRWAAYDAGSPRYEWLVTHGPEHGWVAPEWARPDGVSPQPWHFEYVG